MSQIWMNTLLSWTHAVQTLYEGFKMYIAGEMGQNLKKKKMKRMHDNRTMKDSYAT